MNPTTPPRTVLVTGATGALGTPTVGALRAAGHDVRSLSRRRAPGLLTGDLLSGAGVPEAVAGADTVVHLATTRGHGDVAATRNLLAAAREAGVAHLLLISIVGIESIPMGYYRDKVTVERLVAESGLPYTVLRATQFHSLVDEILAAQRFSPVLLAPGFALQPIAVEDVAGRLTELTGSGPSGRVPDIGGPRQRAVGDLAAAWRRAKGSRRPVLPLKLPGKAFAGFAAGHGLVPGPAYGHRAFEDYLAARYGAARQGAG
jgi:uncharacterized protein YbjT (DUF2867 family)